MLRIVNGRQAITLDHYAPLVAALSGGDPVRITRALVAEIHSHSLRGSQAEAEAAEAEVEAAIV